MTTSTFVMLNGGGAAAVPAKKAKKPAAKPAKKPAKPAKPAAKKPTRR